MYLYAKHIQNIPNGSKVKRTDGHASARLVIKKFGVWRFHWLDLVNMYVHAKYYQNILSGLKVISIFKNWLWTDKYGDYRALLISPPFGCLYCGLCISDGLLLILIFGSINTDRCKQIQLVTTRMLFGKLHACLLIKLWLILCFPF